MLRLSLLSRRRRWQVEIVHPEARQPWVRLVGANGEITLRSEEFDSLSNARRAGLRAAEELRLNLREVKE